MSQPLNLTDQYLMDLSLKGIRESLRLRVKEALDNDLDYEGFLNLILFDEVQHRQNLRRKRLLKAAGFRCHASLESVTCSKIRNLERKQIQELATLRFIDDGLNVMIFGATGVGKTYLATALGNHVCRNGKSTLFFKMNLLLERIALARAEGTYLNLLKKVHAADLVIIDDFGIKAMAAQQYQDFYDILSERENGKSVILTTQLQAENWDEVVSDPLVCEAISDRLTARAIKINIKGPSKRREDPKELTNQIEGEN